MPLKVFISHSSVDTEVAAALINLLKGSLNLPSSAIRCTSVDGYRLPGGANTTETLRHEVEDSELFIGLITRVSIQSTYVLFELGARWNTGKHLLPILAAGAKPNILKAPLNDYNALDCGNESQIYQLVVDISNILDITPERSDTYRDLVSALSAESRKRGESDKEFRIVIGPYIVGQISDRGSIIGTLITLLCTIINTSDKHIILDHCELKVKIGSEEFQFSPMKIQEGMVFGSSHQEINISRPEQHDLSTKTDSIAPGQAISGLMAFAGPTGLQDRISGVNFEEAFIIEVFDVDGLPHQAKVTNQSDRTVGIDKKLGFVIRDL